MPAGQGGDSDVKVAFCSSKAFWNAVRKEDSVAFLGLLRETSQGTVDAALGSAVGVDGTCLAGG